MATQAVSGGLGGHARRAVPVVMDTKRPDLGDMELVYTGAFARQIRSLKYLSITSCVGAVASAPVLAFLSNVEVPTAVRIGMPVLVASFGTFTTFMLDWIVKPYIHHMYYHRATDQLVAETRSLLNRPRYSTFRIADMQMPSSAGLFTTFEVGGRSFFLHREGHEDKDLYRRIVDKVPSILSQE